MEILLKTHCKRNQMDFETLYEKNSLSQKKFNQIFRLDEIKTPVKKTENIIENSPTIKPAKVKTSNRKRRLIDSLSAR